MLNPFTTREMLPLVERQFWAPSFIRDRYFTNINTFSSALIDYDIRDKSNSICPASAPSNSVPLGNKGWIMKSAEPICFAAEIQTNAEEMISQRAIGDNCYSSRSPEERMALKIKDDLEQLDRYISAAEEKLCRDFLIYGKLRADGKTINKTYDFWDYMSEQEKPERILNGTAAWDATATAQPLRDLREAARRINNASGISPTDCILGVEAFEALMAYLKTNDQEIDTRRLDLGMIKPEELKNGVEYVGRLSNLDLYVYSHELTYTSYASGNAVERTINIFPTKAVLIGSTQARCSLNYGYVPLVNKTEDNFQFVAMPRVPYSEVRTTSPKGRILTLETRVLPVCHEPKTFLTLWPLGKQEQD